MLNIMILAHEALQIFCSQCPLWLKCLCLKREIIQSTIHRILGKVNEVIYIMYPNCMPGIMIIVQAVIQIVFFHNVASLYNTSKSEKGDNYAPNFKEVEGAY